MNDAEMITYLRENGYPEHVVKAGRRGLVDRWNKFVDSVERGYTFGLDDYRNDLDLRSLIAAAGLASQVADADKRLRALLVHTRQPVWESDAADAFWVCGYPRNAGDDLLSDLRAQGLAPADRCAR